MDERSKCIDMCVYIYKWIMCSLTFLCAIFLSFSPLYSYFFTTSDLSNVN